MCESINAALTKYNDLHTVYNIKATDTFATDTDATMKEFYMLGCVRELLDLLSSPTVLKNKIATKKKAMSIQEQLRERKLMPACMPTPLQADFKAKLKYG